MPVNKDKLLLSKEDLSLFRDISANIKESKIDIFIREAQLLDIREFLGAELYSLMVEDYDEVTKDFTEERFEKLWFGITENNIIYNGLISAACYFTYSRFLIQQQVNVSRFGVESVQNEISEDISNAQVRSKSHDAKQVALKYQKQALDFLRLNKVSYPEFHEDSNSSNRTSFSFFKL